MQIILELTEDQAAVFQALLREVGYATRHLELLDMIDAAITDAKSREVSAAPRIAKKYVLDCEPGVIFGKLAPIGEKPEK